MAQAARRGPDIIERQSIPLSAVADAPVLDVPAPPTSASAHPDDQARGVAKEITPQELAVAADARKGDPATASSDTDDATKPAPKAPEADTASDDDDGVPVPDNLPQWANYEVAKIRKQYRDLKKAAMDAAKTEAGSDAWEAAWTAAETAVTARLKAQADKNGRDARKAQEDLDAAMKQIEALKANPPDAQDPVVTDPRPKRDEFDDPDQYDEALTSWGEREGERKATKKAAEEKALADKEAADKAEQERREAHEAEVKVLNDRWVDRRAAAIEQYPDYEKVAESAPEDGGPTISGPMAAAIVQIENGTEVAYYLGQNKEESERIATIANPALQLIEMGKLAERLANPVRVRTRRAQPIEPIDSGNSGPADTTDAEPDMETYAARRQKELARGRQPFFPPSQMH